MNNTKIGFNHEEDICPWCKETFGYNSYNMISMMKAGKDWHTHVMEKHKKEYKEVNEKYSLKKTIGGKVMILPNTDLIFNLIRGRLPEEAEADKQKNLKAEYEKKKQELEDLKKQMENTEEKKQ